MTSSTRAAPGFTGNPLDRADQLREKPAELAALRERADARLLALEGLDPLLDDGHLRWRPLAEATPGADLALLGFIEGVPHFVEIKATITASAPMAVWGALATLSSGEAAVYATARSLVDWHARHRFCANCGEATRPERGGWSRRCGACSSQHFPRTDPVVIMLAQHDGRILLARQPQFPAGRYSALAGFVEVGESIEDAVIRETQEECGIPVRNVRYIASQPWPFPSSLMIACISDAEHRDLTLDTTEIEAAIWCDRGEVEAALAGDPQAPFIAPPPIAIAYSLLTAWVDGQKKAEAGWKESA